MMKEASGPINFTVFLNMFGEKLKGEWSVLDPRPQLPFPRSFRDPSASCTLCLPQVPTLRM